MTANEELVIQVPGELSRKTVARFSTQVDNVPPANSYILDLSQVGHVEPFGMLLLSAVIRRFVKLRRADEPGVKIQARGHGSNSYAAHMGLYQSFGLAFGKAPGQANGGPNYLPITAISVAELQAAHQGMLIGEAITEHAKKLAQVLLQQSSGPAFSHVAYALTEIMRNVVEHSGSDRIWYAAQHWPTKKNVELAILDDGIGIRTALGRNPRHRLETDKDAIVRALEKEVTGTRPPTDEELMQGDSWRNTGYGLYIVSNLCREHGAFTLCSGTAGVHLEPARVFAHDVRHDGTAIRMRLSTERNDQLSAIIARLTKDDRGPVIGRSRVPLL